MASRVIVAQEARRDLASIVGYLASVDAGQAAGELVESFSAAASQIKAFPKSYPLCADKHLARQGVRKALLGGYVMLYKNGAGVSYVLRVFHQSQDYAQLV